MAFLGSLGKAIGLGEFKSKDIVQGIATGVNEQLKSSMDKTDENVSRLAQLRLTQALRNQELDDNDLRENLASVKELAKKVGGIEEAAYLIQENGLSGANSLADDLIKRKNYAGGAIPIADFIGIEKSSRGAVTALDLAKSVTPSRGIPDISDFGDPGIGIASTLFGYGQGALKKRSAADLAASGIDPEVAVITDIPEIKARGLYEWQVYTADSSVAQVAHLEQVRVRLAKKIANATDPVQKKALQAEDAAAHAEQDLMNEQARKEASLAAGIKLIGPLTQNEIKTYERNISSLIATNFGLTDKSNWQPDSEGRQQWTGAALSAIAAEELQKAVTVLIPEINKAARNGVDPATISNALRKAASQNVTFRYAGFDPADPNDEDPFEFTNADGNEQKLVNDLLVDEQGDKVFPGVPPSFQGNTTVSNPAISAVSGLPAAPALSVGTKPTQQELIDDLLKSDPGSTGAKIKLNSLLRHYPQAQIPQGY